MAVLEAYVDDSASEHGDRRLFLAGYINTAEKWARFSDVWRDQLRASPSLAYLKMSEANNLSGQFRGWPRADCDEKLKGLARLIRHFEPRSIHSSVSRIEFAEIIKPVAPYGFSKPYFYCFQAIMIPLAYSQCESGGDRVPIDFIFDDQQGVGKEARFFYQLIREAQPRAIQKLLSASPVFGNDKEIVPLQAADMLAWHVRRNHEVDPEQFSVPRHLCSDGLHRATDFNSQQLRSMADGFGRIPGTALLKEKAAWKRVKREVVRQVDCGDVPSFRLSRWKNRLSWLKRRIRILLKIR